MNINRNKFYSENTLAKKFFLLDFKMIFLVFFISFKLNSLLESNPFFKLEIRFKFISKPKTKFFFAKAKVKGNPIYPNPNMPIEYIQIMKITYII